MSSKLGKYIDTDKNRCGGYPCLVGRRYTIAQVLAQVAEGRSLKEIAEDFDLEYENLVEAVH